MTLCSYTNALASVFELVSLINSVKDGHIPAGEICYNSWQALKRTPWTNDQPDFGVYNDLDESGSKSVDRLMNLILELKADARLGIRQNRGKVSKQVF